MLSPDLTTATMQHPERARVLADKLHISVGTDNVAAIKGANIILICVKPQVVQEVVKEIGAHVTPEQLLISVAPSLPPSTIEKGLATNVPLIRAFPTTPSFFTS